MRRLVIQLFERIDKLKSENVQLLAENIELFGKLKLRIHNSGKLPSSNRLAKKSLLSKSNGNNQGGQFGHWGGRRIYGTVWRAP